MKEMYEEEYDLSEDFDDEGNCYDFDDDDYCYECQGYGDDYYWDEEKQDLVCACFECPFFDFGIEDY